MIINNNEDILKSIINYILTLHPIIHNRLHILENNNFKSLDIKIYFKQDDTNNCTTKILFIDGTRSYKKNIDKNILINGILSKNIIDKLIDYIINDYRTISYIGHNKDEININFPVNTELNNVYKGIDCNDISVIINFNNIKIIDNKNKLLKDYFKYIFFKIYDQLLYNDALTEENEEYLEQIKIDILNEKSYDEIMSFAKLFTYHDIYDILFNIRSDRFINLCKEHDKMLSKLK